MKTLYYKGEDIDQNPESVIEVQIRDDLLDDWLKIYPNYIENYVPPEKKE